MYRRLLLPLVVALLAVTALLPAAVAADEGWAITRFDTTIDIAADGSMHVVEQIDVDFRDLEKHGIFRDIPVEYQWEKDKSKVRVIDVVPQGVTDATGQAIPYSASRIGAYLELRIGDANRTVSGRNTYRISYRVSGALNPFADHDELFWNVTGNNWPVEIDEASAVVTEPGAPVSRVACYQGPTGSTESCATSAADGSRATFAVDGVLDPGDGMTVVVGLPKGAVRVAAPVLAAPSAGSLPAEEKTLNDYLGFNLVDWLGALVLLLAVGGYTAWRWYESGRDRRYATVYRLTGDASEAQPGLFDDETIVVEYGPPDELRPAELGVVIDEHADSKDLSATIVDLAARGYLSITETEKRKYELTKLKEADGLLPFEALVFNGLFDDGSPVKVSELRSRKFYQDVPGIYKQMYSDAMQHEFFTADPGKVRRNYQILGVLVGVGGIALVVLLSAIAGRGLIGLGVVAGGFAMAAVAGAMPARSAKGREAYRRTLGFKKFIEVADKSRQQFYEQAGIFEKYLPYAITFGSVKKWAGVFQELGIPVPQPSYYSGTWDAFNAVYFVGAVNSFQSSLASSYSAPSTSGGSGGSGFSGGFSGGGGGGGGGGSW